jgi:pimeloyl-ACP methyl ester carboxylesterase
MNDRPALILVPGFLCDAAVWGEQLPALQALAAVQVAEHGLLDSLAAMAEAILAAAPPRFALAGHSMGGRVALEIYRRAPQRVSRLALLDTGCHALPPGAAGASERSERMALLELARATGMRAMAERWVQTMVHPERLQDQPLLNHIVDMLARRTTQHQQQQVQALLARPEAGPLLPQVRCPTLVLSGREDLNSPPQQNLEMAQLIPGAELAIIEHCGHMSVMEQPAELTRQLGAWLTAADLRT